MKKIYCSHCGKKMSIFHHTPRCMCRACRKEFEKRCKPFYHRCSSGIKCISASDLQAIFDQWKKEAKQFEVFDYYGCRSCTLFQNGCSGDKGLYYPTDCPYHSVHVHLDEQEAEMEEKINEEASQFLAENAPDDYDYDGDF